MEEKTIPLNGATAAQLKGFTVNFAPGTQFSYLAGNISGKDSWTQKPISQAFTPAEIEQVLEDGSGGFYLKLKNGGVLGNDVYVWSSLNAAGLFIHDQVMDAAGNEIEATVSESDESETISKVKQQFKMHPFIFIGAGLIIISVIYLATRKTKIIPA